MRNGCRQAPENHPTFVLWEVESARLILTRPPAAHVDFGLVCMVYSGLVWSGTSYVVRLRGVQVEAAENTVSVTWGNLSFFFASVSGTETRNLTESGFV